MSRGRRRAIFNSHGKAAWPSVAQRASNNSITLGTIAAVLAAVPTSGNKLVAVFRSGQGTATHVNHAAPAGWNKIVGVNRTTTTCISIWYTDAGASEATSISFADAGATSAFLDVFEFSGLLAGAADKSASVDGGATLVTTLTVGPTAATTAARELAVAAIGLAGNSIWGNTWTNGFKQQTGTVSTRLSTATKTLTTTADTPSTNETWVTIRNAAGVIATFQARTL